MFTTGDHSQRLQPPSNGNRNLNILRILTVLHIICHIDFAVCGRHELQRAHFQLCGDWVNYCILGKPSFPIVRRVGNDEGLVGPMGPMGSPGAWGPGPRDPWGPWRPLAQLDPPHFRFFALLELSALRNARNWECVLCNLILSYRRDATICVSVGIVFFSRTLMFVCRCLPFVSISVCCICFCVPQTHILYVYEYCSSI